MSRNFRFCQRIISIVKIGWVKAEAMGTKGHRMTANRYRENKTSHQPQHYKRLFTSVSLFVCIVSIKNSNWSMNYAFTLMDTCRRVIFPTCETFNWRFIDFQFTPPGRMSSECHMTCQSAFCLMDVTCSLFFCRVTGRRHCLGGRRRHRFEENR